MAKTPKIKPLGQNVLLRRLEAEEKTKGGIILPDTAKEKPKEGEVLALGEGELDKNGKRKDFQVKKGDRVIFSSYAGTEVKLDGEEYLILSEDDILGVVEA
ncbi:MAG TPA: co-chaperone GroES [Planctomycetota bacterium]|jgi:chaperonin GroES|nr:co-chaperone GroES [Planctomycetota bacterium]